jgi:hypothetical protein
VTKKLADGWYLMSTQDLERELARWRATESDVGETKALRVTIEEALEFRNAGNLPDKFDRTLRLVLRVDDTQGLERLAERRLEFEPDYQDAPTWRREGSRPINVVPLRRPGVAPVSTAPWWEDAEIAALEREFVEENTAGGVRVSGEHRGFIFKTIVALRSQGREVTPESIADSIARWLPEESAARIAREIHELNR